MSGIVFIIPTVCAGMRAGIAGRRVVCDGCATHDCGKQFTVLEAAMTVAPLVAALNFELRTRRGIE